MSGIAVLADIHGNSDALAAVLEEVKRAGVTRLIVLGDLVGYYYSPDRVLELLSAWPSTIIRGNHEELLGRWLAGDSEVRHALRRRYGGGFEACEERLPESARQWLRGLPHPLTVQEDGCRAVLCHGHPSKIDAYVYPDKLSAVMSPEDVQGVDIVWLAHTHYPMNGAYCGVTVCNPGSVGQPRDRDPRAAWALWEPAVRRVTLKRTAWDAGGLLSAVALRDPGVPYLRDVLIRTALVSS